MAGDNVGTSLYIDYTDFAKGIAEANRLIKLNEQQFRTSAAGMDDWSSTSEGLTAKLENLGKIMQLQKSKVTALEAEYEKIKAEKGENSIEAQKFALKLEKERTALAKIEQEQRKYTKALDNLSEEAADSSEAIADNTKAVEDNADASKEAADSSKGLGGAFKNLLAANLVAGAIGAVTSALSGMISGFLGAAEATKEYRRNLAMVEQAAATAGESVANAKDNLLEMGAVTGDVEAAGEAVNNLLAAGIKGENLDKVTKQIQGAAIKWKDTLKVEGIADGLQETLATGSAIGPFAELLERGGQNLETFNGQLANCTTAAEKQNLVMQTLSKMGLEDISEQYKEQNKNMYDAELAALKYNDTMAQIGGIMEPLNTVFTNMKTNMLQNFLPAIQSITNGIIGLATGANGAGQQIINGFGSIFQKIIPKMITGGQSLIGTVLKTVFDLLSKLNEAMPHILALIIDYAQLAVYKLAEILPQVITTIMNIANSIVAALPDVFNRIISALPNLVAAIFDFLTNSTGAILEGATTMLGGIFTALTSVVDGLDDKLPLIVDAITTGLKNFLPKIVTGATNLFNGLIDGLTEFLPKLRQNLPSIMESISNGFITWGPILIKNAVELFKNIITGLVKFLPVLIQEIPKIALTIVEGLINHWIKLAKAGKDLLIQLKNGIIDNLPEIKSVGKNLVEGLWNGIKDTTAWVVDKIKGFGKTIINGVKEVFGIHSPSTVMAEQGEYLGQGLAVGIDKSTPKVLNETKQLGNDVIAELKRDIAGHEQALADIFGVEIVGAVSQATAGGQIEAAGQELGNALANGVAKGSKNIGSALASGVKNGVESAKDKALNAMQGLINAMGSIDFKQDAEAIGWQIGDVIVNAIATVLQSAYGAIGGLVGSLIQLIYNIIKGTATESDVKAIIPTSSSSGVSSYRSSSGGGSNYTSFFDDEAYKHISGTISGMNDTIAADRMERGSQYIILNQTNTSPKALNEAEIYRNSNKAVNLLAAVV